MIDLNVISTYISPIIVIACLVIGYVIKHAVQNKTLNAFIPMILATLGIAANIWNTGIIDLPTVLTGAVSGLASTGLYEGFNNILNLNSQNDIIIEKGETTDLEYSSAKHSKED